jgi:starch-binding outer membrane protein, SusD/RagB family
MKTSKNRLGVSALLPAILLVTACDLDVTNPGPIPDAGLDNLGAMQGLVTGMSADLSLAVTHIAQSTGIMGDDIFHGGSYTLERSWAAGVIIPDEVNRDWANMHRARWVSEDGLDRMQRVMGPDFPRSTLSARAFLLAGFANRMLGENVCVAIFSGGMPQDHHVHFERAVNQFTEALAIAQTLGNSDMAYAARGGRASVLAALGQWAAAAEDAAGVPTDFRYEAVFSTNSLRENNDLFFETHVRREFSVYNTQWADMYGDPRLPWDTLYTTAGAIATGQDGSTPHFRQLKYNSLAAGMPLVKGTEMLLIRAENYLRGGDRETAMEMINEQRAFYGLDPLAAATTEGAWSILRTERGAVLWLEGRRFWDLRRWYDEGLDDFLAGRDRCIPPSSDEIASNPHL